MKIMEFGEKLVLLNVPGPFQNRFQFVSLESENFPAR